MRKVANLSDAISGFAALLTLAFLPLLLFVLQPDRAVATNWSIASGDWFEATNWSAGVPNGSINAYINNSGTSQITTPGAMARQTYVGNTTMGALEISGGGTLQNPIGTYIGYNSNATGIATVSGNGSQWSVTNSVMEIGTRGTGELTVTDGAAVAIAVARIAVEENSQGTATISGQGSSWTNWNLDVGMSGTAHLTIADGALIETNFETVVGKFAPNGHIHFDNGTLTTGGLVAGVSNLSGTGVINARGIVSDLGFAFDETSAMEQQLVLSSMPDQNITINLDLSNPHILGAGYSSLGSMTISGGRDMNSETGYIGYHADSHGQVAITGEGSAWDIRGPLFIGRGGLGELFISDGGRVSSNSVANTYARLGDVAGSIGSVTVSGQESEWTMGGALGFETEFRVGNEGDGTILIDAGGSIVSTRTNAILGSASGASGMVKVSGADSNWTISGFSSSAGLTVGDSGTGMVEIEEGGRISHQGAILGAKTGSEGIVVVRDPSSIWNTGAGDILIGDRGSGQLNIENEGSVSSFASYVAASPGSTGLVNVDGPGSSWSITFLLSIGGKSSPSQVGGTGEVAIKMGGIVTVGHDVLLHSSGKLQLEGGTLSTDEIKFQNEGGQFNWTSGTLHVGTYYGNLSNPGGTLAPGQSVGSTTVNGSYTQGADATLEIELAGLTPDTLHDVVNVTGSISLDGQLQLTLLYDYIPHATDTFTVLDSTGALTGEFENVANAARLDTTDGRGSFLVHYGAGSAFDANQIVLTDFALTGDYNGDGVVNAADFALWRDTDGSPAGYDAWQSHFGLAEGQGGGQSLNAAVPEPAAWRLLLGILFAAAICARRVGQAVPDNAR